MYVGIACGVVAVIGVAVGVAVWLRLRQRYIHVYLYFYRNRQFPEKEHINSEAIVKEGEASLKSPHTSLEFRP